MYPCAHNNIMGTNKLSIFGIHIDTNSCFLGKTRLILAGFSSKILTEQNTNRILTPIANDVNYQSINISIKIITNMADWYRQAANLSTGKTVEATVIDALAIVGKKSSSR